MRQLALCLLLLPVFASAQTPLGERLGESVEPKEKVYFGLFPEVHDFASARAEMVGDSSRLVVKRTSAPDTAYALRAGQIEALRELIETFERSASILVNPNWQVAAGVRPYHLLSPQVLVPYVNTERSQVDIRVGDRVLSGVILDATPDQLVLHPVGSPYAWQAPRSVSIPASEIAWVDVQPVGTQRLARFSPLLGSILGLAVAGADVFLFDGGARSAPLFVLATGAGFVAADQFVPRPPERGTYADRLPVLSERAAFREQTPLDYPGPTASRDILDARSAGSAGPVGTISRWRQQYGWVNVAAIGGASSNIQASGDLSERVRIAGALVDTTPEFLSGVSSPVAGLDVALRPLPWVRIGGTWTSYTEDRPSTERAENGTPIGPEVAYTEPGGIRGYAELVIPSPRAGGFGLEAAVGAGRSTLTTSVVRASTVSGSDLSYQQEATSNHTFLQATLELVAPRRTSFFVRWTSMPSPDGFAISGEERESSQFPGVVVYQRDPHDVTFSSYWDLTWGTRLRL